MKASYINYLHWLSDGLILLCVSDGHKIDQILQALILIGLVKVCHNKKVL